jgi:hypothetical protein
MVQQIRELMTPNPVVPALSTCALILLNCYLI